MGHGSTEEEKSQGGEAHESANRSQRKHKKSGGIFYQTAGPGIARACRASAVLLFYLREPRTVPFWIFCFYINGPMLFLKSILVFTLEGKLS
jgi:hypothetical protein